jgi:hypothetical protein
MAGDRESPGELDSIMTFQQARWVIPEGRFSPTYIA